MENLITNSPMVAYPRPFDVDDLEVLSATDPDENELFGFDGYVLVYRPMKARGNDGHK